MREHADRFSISRMASMFRDTDPAKRLRLLTELQWICGSVCANPGIH
jgi:hypothetical protein